MGDDTSSDRATVALVAEMVRGLQELMRAEFAHVQRQLDRLTEVPEEVARLRSESDALEHRISGMEHSVATGSEWRHIHLPALATGAAVVIVNIVLVVGQLLK